MKVTWEACNLIVLRRYTILRPIRWILKILTYLPILMSDFDQAAFKTYSARHGTIASSFSNLVGF